MKYNERNPTFSFRLNHLLNQRLTKMAKLHNESTRTEHARTVLSKYLKGELIEKKTED
jgi:predicted transcriptional regulator